MDNNQIAGTNEVLQEQHANPYTQLQNNMPYYYTQPTQNNMQQPYYNAAAQPKKNMVAIISLVSSLVSVLFALMIIVGPVLIAYGYGGMYTFSIFSVFMIPVFSLLAIAFSIISKINGKSAYAKAGLVIGIICLSIFIILITISMVMVMPTYEQMMGSFYQSVFSQG